MFGRVEGDQIVAKIEVENVVSRIRALISTNKDIYRLGLSKLLLELLSSYKFVLVYPNHPEKWIDDFATRFWNLYEYESWIGPT